MSDEEKTQQPAKQAQDWPEYDDELAMRAAIFEHKDLEEVLVPVPAWRTKILVRALSGAQRAQWIAAKTVRPGESSADQMARSSFEIVQMSCLHPRTHKPIFHVNDQTDALKKNGAVIDMLAAIALKLSKLDAESMVAARKNLEAVLNSTATINS